VLVSGGQNFTQFDRGRQWWKFALCGWIFVTVDHFHHGTTSLACGPNKRCQFEKISSSVILKFHLVFLHIFLIFYCFFKNSNLWIVIGPFGPIWTYFTKFKIKYIKWLKFEIKFSPDLLEFPLVFSIFLDFLWISKNEQWFGPVYRFEHGRIRHILLNFDKIVTLLPPHLFR
jgi:hypothetical protein